MNLSDSSKPPAANAAGESATTAIAGEASAVAAGAVIVPLTNRMIVRVSGDDRVAFMHGMCSNDIKGLAPGVAAPGLILTEHAHLIADFFAFALADALLLEFDRDLWSNARAHLERFLVADDVEFEELGDAGVIDLEGPAAGRVAAALAGDAALALKPWRHLEAGPLRVANLPRNGAPAFTVIAEHGGCAALAAQVRDRAAASGVGAVAEVGADALEVMRIEHGIARVGRDTGDKTIALEARLEPAISYSKGCYVGQETIERATARGGLRKKLFGLRIEGDRQPATGAAIMLDGKEVGRLTSVARSPRFGLIGLAILHHSAWQAGTRVAIAQGEYHASVADLPFA